MSEDLEDLLNDKRPPEPETSPEEVPAEPADEPEEEPAPQGPSGEGDPQIEKEQAVPEPEAEAPPAAEPDAVAELERQLAEERGRNQAYQQIQQQPQPQPAQQPTAEDLRDQFDADPIGFMNQQRQAMKVEFSEQLARQRYGDEQVSAAEAAIAEANKANPMLVQGMLSSADPYGSLVKWHQEQMILADIGGDLSAYKERLLKEARETWDAERANSQQLEQNPTPPQPAQPVTPSDIAVGGSAKDAAPGRQLKPLEDLL